MRIYLTGASGFVGSNPAHVFADGHGAEVVAPAQDVDLTAEVMVRRSIAATRPDAIVHAAIWNDPAGLHTNRRRGWDAYAGATARALGVELPDLGTMPGRLRSEVESSWSLA
jgi:dTDP-4-dehydrorhamnose reductase